ncbi:hypothetical protein ACFSTI_19350 [Rhizorhabdus histidinilytica]
MAKDPKYDRYVGMVTLPGDPLNPRKPRPFRVDEDGNVIYLDEEAGRARPAGGANARAGILGWDELDRRAGERSAPLTATAVRGSVAKGDKGSDVVRTRKTIGGSDYYVISANTYDPALSNGKTAIPNADMIATMNSSGKDIAVRGQGPEKGAFIVRALLDFSPKADDRPASERNLPLIKPKREMYYPMLALSAEPGSTNTANTLSFRHIPVGTVAIGHGHPDGDSLGMIDDWNPSYKPDPIIGDVSSLLRGDPMPMATVSKGRIGWHQMENGRLQFMYPVEMNFSNYEAEKIQENLDRQQFLFQRKVP